MAKYIKYWAKINLQVLCLLVFPQFGAYAQKISLGYGCILYICPDSTISAIGKNMGYQLGDGTNIERHYPVKVKGLHSVAAVNAWGSMALLGDGTVWRWDWEDHYNQTYYTNEPYYKLEKLPIDSVISIGSGPEDPGIYYCFLRADGSLWIRGELEMDGEGYSWKFSDTLTKQDIPKVKSFACDDEAIIALCEDSTVWTCGGQEIYGNRNDTNSISDHYTYWDAYRTYFEKVDSFSGVVAVAASNNTVYALKNDGSVWGWGRGVTFPPKFRESYPHKFNIADVQYIYAEEDYGFDNFPLMYAVKRDGTAWYWDRGMLYSDPPKQVTGIPPVSYISGLSYTSFNGVNYTPFKSTYALDTKDNFWRWGDNDYGQLGNFTTFPIDSPEIMPHPCVAVDCDIIKGNKEVVKLDTTMYINTPITLKASQSESDLYWWYPQSNVISGKYSQVAKVKIHDSTTFVAVIMDSYGCARKEDFIIRKKCNPNKLVFDSLSYIGAKINLRADTGYSYYWTPANILSNYSGCRQTMANIFGPVNYIVTFTDTFNCLRNDTFKVRVTDCSSIVKNPSVLMMDSLIIPGSYIKLTSSSNARIYKWSPTNGLSCNDCRSPIARIYTNTLFVDSITDYYNCNWVERFNLKNNCDYIASLPPKVLMDSVTYPQQIISLNVPGAYSWQPSTGLSCDNCTQPMVTITDPVLYTVSIVDSFHCNSKVKLNFRVRNCDELVKENNIIRLDTVIHYTSEIPLHALSSYEGYKWSPGYGLNCTDCQSPMLTAKQTTTYTAQTYDQWRCAINEIFKVTMDRYEVVIPNVFTPNGDHINDNFEIKGLVPGNKLQIYDNSGKLVFMDANYQGLWNGNDNNGNKLEEGTYWYILQVPDSETYKGWVYIKRK